VTCRDRLDFDETMSTSYINLFWAGLILSAVQIVAALPWIWALDPRNFRKKLTDLTFLGYVAGAVIGLALILAWFMSERRITNVLQEYGRYYGAFLHAQLALDFLVLLPQLLLLVSPKGGAVALATFRECWRQPMFWLMTVLAIFLMAVSMVVPYFTFGEDYKMMKQIGFDIVMFFSALFGLLAASISINEEIEGRTAITVMSKPINRRQFLIGKYIGTLMACWAMTLILGWALNWALYIKPFFDRLDDVNDMMPAEIVSLLTPQFGKLVPTPEGSAFAQGVGIWMGEALAHHVGLLLVFGQVMVLLAICTALATRMPYVINLVICLFVFLIGHLSPVLVQFTQQLAQEEAALKLVSFIAQLFNAIFPSLEYFNMGPAIIRDSDVPMRDFTIYVLTVLGYAVLYSAIGIILGLLLFEDRDLA
jgi:ABC-type transport system involved in multi-copper enzyme maturation permease subunit